MTRNFRFAGFLLPAFTALFALAAFGDAAAFDLSGPTIEMTVTRAGQVLPISSVPNLQVGDRLWIHPMLPDQQSARFLLVVAFLRGTTNPSPENWFTRAETWNRQVKAEGVVVTVPEGAEQALLFLAPETGGDFTTLRSAVRSKPGVFVRAAQDLNQAGLDRTRSDKYIADIKSTSDDDPKALHDRSQMLARTLSLKIDQVCFDHPIEEQSACLTQSTDQLVLDDGHSQSMVAALTSGPTTDLMGAVSSTSLARGGYYSPYVGSAVDLAKLLGNLKTAEYQYIPALSVPDGPKVSLRLNNPPSFRNPKSVLVIGLPAIEAAQLPPLRASSTDQVFCLEKAPLILPTQGAPLVFSTTIAHDFVLHLEDKDHHTLDLPAVADAGRGGFVVDTRHLNASALDPALKGTLRGEWGFDSFEGPAFAFENAHATNWKVPSSDQSGLVVGREDIVHLMAEYASCVDQVALQDHQGRIIPATWKATKPDQLELTIPMKDQAAGPVNVAVKQYGLADADTFPMMSYAEAATLDGLSIAAGDQEAMLIGTRLDQVSGVRLKASQFAPKDFKRIGQKDQLRLTASGDAPGNDLRRGEKLVAQVSLKDGRNLELQTTVQPARPKVELVSKSVQLAPTSSPLRLADQNELPQNGRISFLLKSDIPENFPSSEKIEVATEDGSFDVLLSAADGGLLSQNSNSTLAVLDPLKSFGPAAFGPLHFRAVEESDGEKGDWQPLATLVRVPVLKDIHCPDSPDKQCTLIGSNLFLIDSVASDSQFKNTVSVPLGFADSTMSVPRPNGTLLYLKLRDDPTNVDMLILPVLPDN